MVFAETARCQKKPSSRGILEPKSFIKVSDHIAAALPRGGAETVRRVIRFSGQQIVSTRSSFPDRRKQAWFRLTRDRLMKKQIVGFVGALTLSGVGAFVAATEPEGASSAPVVKPVASKSVELSSPDADGKSEPPIAGDGSAIKQVSHVAVETPAMPATADEVSHWDPATHAPAKSAPEKTAGPRAVDALPNLKVLPPPEKPAAAAPRSATTTPVTAIPAEPKKITLEASDPHALMQKARDLYVANRLDEAEALGQMLAAYPTRWSILEDSPKRLLEDVQKARQRAKDEDATAVLIEARKLFSRGMYDESERLAHMAERMHGPYRMFDSGDKPQRLLGEIAEARLQASKPRVQPVPAAREATVHTAPANTNWQEAPKAHASENQVVQTPAKAAEAVKPGEAVKSADAVKAGTAKPDTTKAAATAKAAEAKPDNTAKPVETVKTAETPKLIAEAKPESSSAVKPQAKPATDAKLVIEPKVVDSTETIIIETPRLVPEPKVVETPKVAELKRIETARLVPEPKPIEAPKVAEPKRIETPKILAEAKPIEVPKPSADAKPAATNKPAEASKPAEATKPAESKPVIVQTSASVTAKTADVVPASAVFVGPPYLPKTGVSVASDVVLAQPEGMPEKLPAPVVGQAVRVSAPEKTAAAPEKAAAPAPPAKPVAPASAPVVVPAPPAPCAAPTCCDKSCSDKSCCDKSCGHDDSGLCLYGDVGFSIMRPYFKTNPAFFVGTEPTPNSFVGRIVDFGLGTQFVPEINIGVVGCDDLGFRVGWWGFATGDHQTVTAPAGNGTFTGGPLGAPLFGIATGDTAAADAHLNMNVWTFEVTQDYKCGPCTVMLAAGLRYAHIAQQFDAVDLSNTALFLHSGHNFDGIGPTLYLRGRRQCGCSGAYLFADARGSLLVGQFKQAAISQQLRGEGTLVAIDLADSSRMVMGEGELELGAGWRRDYSGIDVFLEAGVTGQLWSEVGNSSRSTLGFEGFSGTVDNNLGLMGITIRAGINY
jgi:hypothetical protein